MAANFTTTGSDTFPAGQVIQTVSSFYPTHWTQVMNSSTYENVNNGSVDLSISITPASTSNKVLVSFSFGRVAAHNTGSGHGLGVIITRNGTHVGVNTGPTNIPRCSFSLASDSHHYDGACMTFEYLDSPSSTSACVYKLQCIAHSTSNYTTLWNRGTYTGSNTYEGHAAITSIQFFAQEIKG